VSVLILFGLVMLFALGLGVAASGFRVKALQRDVKVWSGVEVWSWACCGWVWRGGVEVWSGRQVASGWGRGVSCKDSTNRVSV
jgi:hypothetical protein